MLKKKLILITFGIEPKKKYIKDLKDFFEDYVDIEGYSIEEGINKTIYGDLALITTTAITNLAKKYLPDEMEIIHINRTFSKGSFEQLYTLPQNTKCMLVNNSNMGAIETISLLYEMGVKHIDFTPVYPNMDYVPNLKYAVTPGQFIHVPKSVEKIIDIGWRIIDISTLMNIVTKLNISNKNLDKKLEQYFKKIVPISYGLHYIFNNKSKIKNELNIVLDVIDDGVMVIDKHYTVIHCNKCIGKILNIDENKLINKNIKNQIISPFLLNKFIEKEYIENSLIKYPPSNKSLIITKRPINVHDRIYGYVLIIKDKTEIENLETQLRKELLDRGYTAKYRFENIVGLSEGLIECKNKAKKISKIDTPVLITGESGTGKELFAQSIHNASERKNKPFLGINCATLSPDLLESELFGYEEGAFTGAKKGGKKGLFELAHTGSLFLDEIGELPMNMQVKLLRVLQEKEVMRIGGMRIIPINVRIIAATNQNLKEMIQERKFRKDLYYRLNVLTLHLPPLRERKKDIPYLIKDMLKEIKMDYKSMDQKLLNTLINYYWDGNIRELKNCIEYMAYMGEDLLTIKDLPPDFNKITCDTDPLIEDHLFKELLIEENELAVYILNALKYRSAGRRSLYNEALKDGFNISEHKIRKVMDFLHKKKLILYGNGRRGSKLTEQGKSIISEELFTG